MAPEESPSAPSGATTPWSRQSLTTRYRARGSKGAAGYVGGVEPFPGGFGEITRDLEALKPALVEMNVEDLAASDASALARQISPIRLT